jgi:hypothetical protein
MMDTKLCSMPNCDRLQRAGQRYCAECHKVYMRAWRARRRREAEELKNQVLRLRKRVVDLEQENRELKVS